MTGYYDLILGLIPVSLLGLSGALVAAGLTLTTAVTVGGLIAVTLVAHGLFVNDPAGTEPPADRVTDHASTGFETAD